jgi:hypothetical protein
MWEHQQTYHLALPAPNQPLVLSSWWSIYNFMEQSLICGYANLPPKNEYLLSTMNLALMQLLLMLLMLLIDPYILDIGDGCVSKFLCCSFIVGK